MKTLVLFAALQSCTCAASSNSGCNARLHEEDLQGYLSLVQKRAANHQSHVRDQADAEQPKDKASTKQQGEVLTTGQQRRRPSGVNQAEEEAVQADAKQTKDEAYAQEEASAQEDEAPPPEGPAQAESPLISGLQRRRTSRVKQDEEAVAEGWQSPMFEEAKKPPVSCTSMQGVMVLGSMGFIMAIFYLVNSTSVIMRFTAWTMVSETTSILVAVLVYDLKHKLIKATFGIDNGGLEDEASEEAAFPDRSEVVLFFKMAIVWWFLVLGILFWNRTSLLHLKAYGTIGGHILGFAYVNAWGSLATTRGYESSHSMVLAILCAYILASKCFIFTKSRLMTKLVSSVAEHRQATLRMWHEQSHETAEDAFCLGASFLMSMWIRFVISGTPAPLREQVSTHSSNEIRALAGVGFCLLLVAAALKKLQHLPDDQDWSWGVLLHMCFSDGSMISAMASGWVFLFAIHWGAFDSFGNSASADTVVALLMSSLAISAILFCYFLRHGFGFTRAMLKGALLGVAMGVGFSWEKVFDSSLENLAEIEGAMERSIELSQGILILVVFPAWMLYMLPHENDELAECMSERLKKGPLPVSALWSDEGLYDAADSKQDASQ